MLEKIEGRRRRGWHRMRRWDGMPSSTLWTWVWVSSRGWWWTGKPDMLPSMGLQRVGHCWATELKWCCYHWLLTNFMPYYSLKLLYYIFSVLRYEIYFRVSRRKMWKIRVNINTYTNTCIHTHTHTHSDCKNLLKSYQQSYCIETLTRNSKHSALGKWISHPWWILPK